jgi:hypothetical protein
MSVLVRYRWFVLAGVVVIVAVLAAVVVWWPRSEPPRQRVYREFDVCLLTPGEGLADPQAAAVWAGAQDVSLERSVRLLYLPVTGQQTPARAGEFLASLVGQGCDVIVAVGAAPVLAVQAAGESYASTTILTVGDEIDGSSSEAITSSTVDALRRVVPAE